MQRSTIDTTKSITFSSVAFKIAAMWWAQYLPGVKKIDFTEINKNTNLTGIEGNISESIYNVFHSHREAVTEEQLNNFINILARKIHELAQTRNEVRLGFSDLHYIQVGHASSYHPPEIIEQAVDEANLQLAVFGTFPFKTEMKIYNNGQIEVDGRVISTDPNFVHYDKHYNFDSAPYMKINGDRFRLVEINLATLKGKLLSGSQGSFKQFELKQALQWGDTDKDISHVYITLHLNHFIGTEKDFLQLSNEELIDGLQDNSKISKYFNDEIMLYYTISKERALQETSFGDLGHVVKEQLGENYYEYSTGPVKVLAAPSAGTVRTYSLLSVHPNDFLIYREKNQCVNVLLTDHSGFYAKLCDKHGNILSQQIYRPGDRLPLAHQDNIVGTSRFFNTHSDIPALNNNKEEKPLNQQTSSRF